MKNFCEKFKSFWIEANFNKLDQQLERLCIDTQLPNLYKNFHNNRYELNGPRKILIRNECSFMTFNIEWSVNQKFLN